LHNENKRGGDLVNYHNEIEKGRPTIPCSETKKKEGSVAKTDTRETENQREQQQKKGRGSVGKEVLSGQHMLGYGEGPYWHQKPGWKELPAPSNHGIPKRVWEVMPATIAPTGLGASSVRVLLANEIAR